MATATRRPPTRTCVVCRTPREKRDLARVVRTPGGDVRLDPSGRLAGRGAYLCRDAACWRGALERGGLPRALSVPVSPALRALIAAGPDAMNDQLTTTTMTSTTTRTED